MQRVSTYMELDTEHAELPAFHFGHDGCLDAPEALPAGSTIPVFKPGHVCDTEPSICERAYINSALA
jgi:hypothetical protein